MAQITRTNSAMVANGGAAALTGVTANRMLVYGVIAYRFFAASPVAGTPSGGGATWTQRAPCTINNNGMAIFVWTGTGTSGGSVTMSYTGGTQDGLGSVLYELDANAGDFDQGAAASGTSTSASSGTLPTLQDADDLLIGFFGSESQFNAFTMSTLTERHDAAIGPPDDYKGGAGDLQVTGTSVAATATNDFSTYWVASGIAIKTSGGAAATSSPPLYLPSRSNRALLRR